MEVDIHSRTSSPTRGCHSHRRAQAPAILATANTEREGIGNVGDMVGSLEPDSFQGHMHATDQLHSVGDTDARGTERIANSDQPSVGYRITSDVMLSDGVHGAPRISAETRPQNAGVNYLIKY